MKIRGEKISWLFSCEVEVVLEHSPSRTLPQKVKRWTIFRNAQAEPSISRRLFHTISHLKDEKEGRQESKK